MRYSLPSLKFKYHYIPRYSLQPLHPKKRKNRSLLISILDEHISIYRKSRAALVIPHSRESAFQSQFHLVSKLHYTAALKPLAIPRIVKSCRRALYCRGGAMTEKWRRRAADQCRDTRRKWGRSGVCVRVRGNARGDVREYNSRGKGVLHVLDRSR